MYIQKENIDNEIFTKKVILLNKLYYIITHQIWTYKNMSDLDNLINRFTDLSDSLKKPKDEDILCQYCSSVIHYNEQFCSSCKKYIELGNKTVKVLPVPGTLQTWISPP